MKYLICALLAVCISCEKKPASTAISKAPKKALEASNENSIDTAKSRIEWVGRKVTGEHSGLISIKSGKLQFKDGHLSGGEFVVDMTTISCTDIKDPKSRQSLVSHLKNDDFFSTDKFPEASLKITHAMLGKGVYDVVADLTIKGKTHPVTFQANLPRTENGTKKISGEIIFDRTLYDVRYNSGKFFESLGDKLIYDDIELRVELTLF